MSWAGWGGGRVTSPKFGCRGAAEGLKPWACLGQKKAQNTNSV